MPASPTAHLGSSPFTASGTNASKKAARKTVNHNRPRIDTATLTIKKDIPLPMARIIPGKYDKFFKDLQPKDCVDCAPNEAAPISQALRKYLKENKLDGHLAVVVAQYRQDNPERGGVWAWPKAELPETAPLQSAGGRATSAKRKGDK